MKRTSRILHSLFLFLMFKDKYAEQTHAFEATGAMMGMAMTLATLELILAGLFFYLLQISMALTMLAFVGLTYGMLQLLHFYDYLRARRPS